VKQIQLFKILSLACVLIFAASTGYAGLNGESVGVDDFADSRTLSEGELDGTWAGNDFTISWLIEPDTDYWTYSYTLIGSMTPSTFILESPDQNSIWDLYINGNLEEVGGAKDEFGTWRKNGRVYLPNFNSIYGHKFEVTGGDITTSTVQFKTNCPPVWGNFHTMGAVGANEAYNWGLTDTSSNDPKYFIARPDLCNVPACPDNDGDEFVVCDSTCDPGGLQCGDCDDNNPLILEICGDKPGNNCDNRKDKQNPKACGGSR
jgi:hypothetical protein